MKIRHRLLSVLILAILGCDEAVEKLEPVALDQLPAGSLEAAAKELPGVKFDRARKAKVDGQEAFEIIGQDKHGKIREVEVSTTGKILAVE
jgi:hypothetical protein